jgi:hypothetical protein
MTFDAHLLPPILENVCCALALVYKFKTQCSSSLRCVPDLGSLPIVVLDVLCAVSPISHLINLI